MTFANRSTSQFKRFFTSKSYQSATKRNLNRYFNQSDLYFFLKFKQKSTYINNSQNRNLIDRSSNFEIIVKQKNT